MHVVEWIVGGFFAASMILFLESALRLACVRSLYWDWRDPEWTTYVNSHLTPPLKRMWRRG